MKQSNKQRIKSLEAKIKSAQNSLSMSVNPSKRHHWKKTLYSLQADLAKLKEKIHGEGNIPSVEPEVKKFSAEYMLKAAYGHMQDRSTTYDKPEGERSIPNVVAMFNIATGRDLTPEEGWLFQVLLKIVRANQGNFKLDNYEDLIAYAALYGEEAANAQTA